jgi:hypothetical protein
MICKKEIVPTEFMTDEFGFACHIDATAVFCEELRLREPRLHLKCIRIKTRAAASSALRL